MSGHEQETDIRDSTPNGNGPDGAAGGMGVSSEREGQTGPGQYGTDGVRDVSPSDREPDADVSPEQAAGGVEVNPDSPIPPVAGYPPENPLSEDTPYDHTPKH